MNRKGFDTEKRHEKREMQDNPDEGENVEEEVASPSKE